MIRQAHGTLILLALTTLTGALAAGMAWTGRASWLEAASFVTGAVCVWLTVRENIWNFPVGLVNVCTFSVVFFRAGLYADAGLQVVYFILGVVGWYMWLYGGKHRTRLHVGLTGSLERSAIIVAVLVGTLLLWRLLSAVGGSVSFWDALTTALSLGAQWLLNRKRLESWLLWITVDLIYVPLYIYKGLHLTALLYTVFLVMAAMGLRQWFKTWALQRNQPTLPATTIMETAT